MWIDKELLGVQDAINRWGKEANTKLGVAMDIADTYTTLEASMPLILEFSRTINDSSYQS